jgi:hypothetical protein
MAITSIVRDWGTNPAIVRVTSTDTLATVAGAAYLTAQAANIATVNSGVFEWVVGDMVAMNASDGSEFFRFDGDDFTTFIQLPGGNGEVTLPVTSGDFTVFDGTLGALKDLGYLPSDASKTSVVMAGSAVVANHIAKFVDTAGTIDDTAGTAINSGSVQAGLSGTAGTLVSFPGTAANGSLIVAAANAGANFNTTISNVTSVGQSQVISIPDAGAATAKFLLDTGTGATATITKLSTGATPVPFVDPGSCTITAAAGAANTSTITIQLKDGAGVNIARVIPFKVYSSSASNGLTLQTAASTGYSVASGGLSLANGTAVTTQISAMSSATGGCVLSLLDTGKQTSYLVLVVEGGIKISAQLSAGSYG